MQGEYTARDLGNLVLGAAVDRSSMEEEQMENLGVH